MSVCVRVLLLLLLRLVRLVLLVLLVLVVVALLRPTPPWSHCCAAQRGREAVQGGARTASKAPTFGDRVRILSTGTSFEFPTANSCLYRQTQICSLQMTLIDCPMGLQLYSVYTVLASDGNQKCAGGYHPALRCLKPTPR